MPNQEMNIKNLYFAGPLFDHSQLISNLYLARAIEEISGLTGQKYKYKCTLPQNLTPTSSDAKEIKNNNLKYLKASDGAIFNFNGPEQDSGTVVEYMANIFLKHPTVVYRTDFREGGDDHSYTENTKPWNLMLSNYPYVKQIVITSTMEECRSAYNECQNDPGNTAEALSLRIAKSIINALDELFDVAPLPDHLNSQIIGDYFDEVCGL